MGGGRGFLLAPHAGRAAASHTDRLPRPHPGFVIDRGRGGQYGRHTTSGRLCRPAGRTGNGGARWRPFGRGRHRWLGYATAGRTLRGCRFTKSLVTPTPRSPISSGESRPRSSDLRSTVGSIPPLRGQRGTTVRLRPIWRAPSALVRYTLQGITSALDDSVGMTWCQTSMPLSAQSGVDRDPGSGVG